MRLWTIHPRYLDPQGLTAAWREALLAQKVLCDTTKGYRFHPQLVRFRSHSQPLRAIAMFLFGLTEEAERRGYHFDATKILEQGPVEQVEQIEETEGQLLYEWAHLREKLHRRTPDLHRQFRSIVVPQPHPLFRIVPGGVRECEKLRPVRAGG